MTGRWLSVGLARTAPARASASNEDVRIAASISLGPSEPWRSPRHGPNLKKHRCIVDGQRRIDSWARAIGSSLKCARGASA
eukprot:389165-Prymnesium_polylepis.1